MTYSENGTTGPAGPAAPQTITTGTNDTPSVEGDATTPFVKSTATVGFLDRAASGKAIGFVDPWGDERDLLTSRMQLDRAISIVEAVMRP